MTLYESTGLVGQSTIRQVDRTTGAVIRSAALPSTLYGEGLALVDDHFIQLTWKDGEALVWDAATLTQTGSFRYTGEGWGLCYDGTRLVMSDGSSTLTFRDPVTFEVTGSVERHGAGAAGRPAQRAGVRRWFGLGQRLGDALDRAHRCRDGRGHRRPRYHRPHHPDPSVADPGAVLNGIAYDPVADTFLLTGKRWPSMFEVRISGG